MREKARELLRENVSSHWWNISKKKILSELVKQLDISYNSNVLELGIGTGDFLAGLKFKKKIGIDPYLCKVTDKDFSFIQGDAGYLPLKEATIDLLLLIDVMEHIKDDGQLVRNCFNVLRKNGKLIIFVPALQVLWSDLDRMSMHYRRYTANNLQALIASVNVKYKIIKSSYTNFFLFVPILILRLTQRLIKKIFSQYDSSCLKKPPSAINSILKIIFSSERFFLRFLNFPIGVSYVCIIEKI